MTITWSEFDDESEEESANKVIAFTRKYESGEESSDEDMSEEKLVATFRFLHAKWKEACITTEKQKKT